MRWRPGLAPSLRGAGDAGGVSVSLRGAGRGWQPSGPGTRLGPGIAAGRMCPWRLENGSQNPRPNPSPPTGPSVPHLRGSGTPLCMVTPALPGQLCQCSTAPEKKCSPIPNLSFPALRGATASHPIAIPCEQRPTPPHHNLSSGTAGSNDVSPQPLLHSEPSQCPQLLPQRCAQTRTAPCPSLATLWSLNVFLGAQN